MRKHFLGLAALLCASGLHGQNVGYVVDNGSSVVHVVDLQSRQVTARIPSGVEPSEMLVLPNNRLAFVSNPGSNDVAVLDLNSNVRLGTIPAGVLPGSLIASADGRFLYVANDGSNNVTIIDTAARRVVDTIPVGATPVQVNLSPDGRFLYAVNQDETPGTISVIDTNRRQMVKTITVGQRPSQLAISPKQTVAYVVNSGGASLTLIDLARNDAILTIPVRNGPASVAFSTDGRFVYSVNRDAASITVIDSEQFHRIVTHIGVGTQPAAMVVTYDSKFGYVSNQGSGTVSVLDLATNAAEETITVGRSPFSLALDPNEDFLYVTNLGAGTVSVVDVNTDRVAATIPVGAVPVQFQMLNAPTLLELAPNPSPAGSRITLNGEGFLPGSTVRFVTTAPPRTTTAPVAFLDSQGLEVTVPSFPGASAAVSVANPDGNSSEEVVWRPGTAAPSIFAGGVVEGAGFARAPYPISGGAIVSVFGNFPGVVEQQAASFPLPSTLGNAAVTFNGVRAPLLFTSAGQTTSPGQINLVAPVRLLALESARVAVTVSGQTSAVETASVASVGPGVFLNSMTGTGAFLPARAVRRGETVAMFVTGLGETIPPPIDGEPAPSDVLSPTRVTPVVTVGGATATVRFSGLAPGFSGLYQINFDVPAAAPTGAEVPVTVTAGGRLSNSVRLVVEP